MSDLCTTITGLPNAGDGEATDIFLIIRDGISYQITLDELTALEQIARAAQDDAIEAGVGLNADGTFTTDENSGYGTSSLFSVNGQTPSIASWLKNVDTATLAAHALIVKSGLLAPVKDIVSPEAGPPTEANGDAYLVNGGTELTGVSVAWQSGNTVRYVVDAGDDLSSYNAGDYFEVNTCGNSINNGIFKISAVVNASHYVEVTNTGVTDNTDDEAVVFAAWVTDSAWDGVGHWYHAMYDSTTDLWTGTAPVNGVGVFAIDVRDLYFYNSTTDAYEAYSSTGVNSQVGSNAVTRVGNPNSITIADVGTTAYNIMFRCYDALGNNVDIQIDNKAATGFDVTVASDATFEWDVKVR